jgi:hypothetical protein
VNQLRTAIKYLSNSHSSASPHYRQTTRACARPAGCGQGTSPMRPAPRGHWSSPVRSAQCIRRSSTVRRGQLTAGSGARTCGQPSASGGARRSSLVRLARRGRWSLPMLPACRASLHGGSRLVELACAASSAQAAELICAPGSVHPVELDEARPWD